MHGGTPELDVDLFDAPARLDPYPLYKTIRDLGPVVWLPRHNLFAIGRFEDVRAALRADMILKSGHGVAANELLNQNASPITLTSDGETHLKRRNILIQPVSPGPLRELKVRLEASADEAIRALANGEEFDAMSAFSSHLPVSIVAELVGLNEEGRQNMLRWAAATFDALGTLNERGTAALPTLFELGAYIQGLGRDKVAPGGWAARLFDAADRGELSPDEARSMVIDYVAPALDTTILATGFMLYFLATTPGAYETVRENPDLVPGVVNESVRLGSPLRSFTRHVSEDFEVSGACLPQGARVLISYASANRDERHYPVPDAFDVRRNPRDHVGWGHGAHTCVGMHLARLEMEVLLSALVRHVARIEVGFPERLHNNCLQGYSALPATFFKAAA